MFSRRIYLISRRAEYYLTQNSQNTLKPAGRKFFVVSRFPKLTSSNLRFNCVECFAFLRILRAKNYSTTIFRTVPFNCTKYIPCGNSTVALPSISLAMIS